MHVEVDIAKEKAKSMPKGSILALQEELTRRLGKKYGEVWKLKRRVPTRYTSVARLKLSGKRLTPFCKRRGKALTTGSSNKPISNRGACKLNCVIACF